MRIQLLHSLVLLVGTAAVGFASGWLLRSQISSSGSVESHPSPPYNEEKTLIPGTRTELDGDGDFIFNIDP